MRIVLAVDGSGSSEQARDLIASLPWPAGTSITLLRAWDIPATWLAESAMAGGDWLSNAEAAMQHDAEASLANMATSLEGRGWTIDRRVVRGRAAGAILAAARELDADLIALGSRGHGTIASMLLGSVSAEVAELARCSVLVARAPRVSRLLVATDGSACAGIIPDVLAGWGSFKGLPAIALSVTPVASPAFRLMVGLYTLGSMSLEQEQDETRALYGRHAAAMAEGLSRNGIPAESDTRDGDAAGEIIRAAAEVQADLVVTGSRCLHGLDRWILGSVARNVLLHTGASVLIVRRKGAPPPS
jgi:nucleotide-binding universal stress UspA family protein